VTLQKRSSLCVGLLADRECAEDHGNNVYADVCDRGTDPLGEV